MSTRYQAREVTETGFGREFYCYTRKGVRSLIDAIGGVWRVRRQWKGGYGARRPGWHLDRGRDAVVLVSAKGYQR